MGVLDKQLLDAQKKEKLPWPKVAVRSQLLSRQKLIISESVLVLRQEQKSEIQINLS